MKVRGGEVEVEAAAADRKRYSPSRADDRETDTERNTNKRPGVRRRLMEELSKVEAGSLSWKRHQHEHFRSAIELANVV